jgi:hypothetical protein
MAYSDEIKKFAQDLYLQYDTEGGHKYSLQGIADEVTRKFNENLTKVTIHQWAESEGWNELFQAGMNRGIEKAVNDAKEKDESIKEAKAKDAAKVYKLNKAIMEAGGFLLLDTLQYYAKKRQAGEITTDEVLESLRIPEIAGAFKLATDNIERMEGGSRDKESELAELLKSL